MTEQPDFSRRDFLVRAGQYGLAFSVINPQLRDLFRSDLALAAAREDLERGILTAPVRADLYGAVVFYDGRPSQTQLDRTNAIGHELSDVVAAFDAWSAKDLAALNTELGTKNLQPIVLLTRQDWEGVGKGGR